MKYVLTDIDGTMHSITDVDGVLMEMELENIIAYYKCSKAYYEVHKTFKSLADKGFIYEPREPYPFKEVEDTMSFFKERIIKEGGQAEFDIVENHVNDALKDNQFLHSLGENILGTHNYKPSVKTLIREIKDPNFYKDL